MSKSFASGRWNAPEPTCYGENATGLPETSKQCWNRNVPNLRFGSNLKAIYVPIGSLDAKNLAITTFTTRRSESKPEEKQAFVQVANYTQAIQKAVVSRQMPPWFADPNVGHFANERRLSTRDIDTINAWVDGGSPAGAEV